jgi:hypothetical protein
MMGNVTPLSLRAKRSSSVVLARSALICFEVSRHGHTSFPIQPESVKGRVFVDWHEPVADQWSAGVSTSSTRTEFGMSHPEPSLALSRHHLTQTTVRPEPVEGLVPLGGYPSQKGRVSLKIDYFARINGMGKKQTP